MQWRAVSVMAFHSHSDNRNSFHRRFTQVASHIRRLLLLSTSLPFLSLLILVVLLSAVLLSLSVIHLLSVTPDRFRVLTGSEQTDVRVLRALHDECLEWQHPVVIRSGWDVWCEWKENLLVFSTGCEELDTILAGV